MSNPICQGSEAEYNICMKVIRVPIYPNADVVFPGQLSPVFAEARGVDCMLRYCREQRQPLGMVFVPDANGRTLAGVGTLAYLLEDIAQKPQDFANLFVVGQYRFQILQIHQDQSYLEATVELWPWVEEPRPGWLLVERLGGYLRRYVQALSNVLPSTLLPEVLQPGVSTLGVLGAALLPLPAADKQRLLEMPTAKVLLSEVVDYMRVYVPLAERLAKMPPRVVASHEYISFN